MTRRSRRTLAGSSRAPVGTRRTSRGLVPRKVAGSFLDVAVFALILSFSVVALDSMRWGTSAPADFWASVLHVAKVVGERHLEATSVAATTLLAFAARMWAEARGEGEFVSEPRLRRLAGPALLVGSSVLSVTFFAFVDALAHGNQVGVLLWVGPIGFALLLIAAEVGVFLVPDPDVAKAEATTALAEYQVRLDSLRPSSLKESIGGVVFSAAISLVIPVTVLVLVASDSLIRALSFLVVLFILQCVFGALMSFASVRWLSRIESDRHMLFAVPVLVFAAVGWIVSFELAETLVSDPWASAACALAPVVLGISAVLMQLWRSNLPAWVTVAGSSEWAARRAVRRRVEKTEGEILRLERALRGRKLTERAGV